MQLWRRKMTAFFAGQFNEKVVKERNSDPHAWLSECGEVSCVLHDAAANL